MSKKITYKGKSKIIIEDDKKEVIKENNRSLTDLFDYLDKRDYQSHPNIISEEEDYIKYEYIDEYKLNDEISNTDFIKTISSLHLKTTQYKDVSKRKYKDIYNRLMDNIDYLKEEANSKIQQIDDEVYMSPSNYLYARNYSLIFSNLIYIERSLNNWFNKVKDKTKERVCVVHNNLKKDNCLNSKVTTLTGWDNYVIDTPALDLYKLYRNEYKNIDFVSFFNVYSEDFKLSEEEKELIKILISMPLKIKEDNKEIVKVSETTKMIDYIIRTNKLIKSGVLD